MTEDKKRVRIYLVMVGLRNLSDHNVTPPIGLLYLAAYIRERIPAEIRIANQRLEGWSSDRLAKEIAAFKPDILGLSSSTLSAHFLGEITRRIREVLPEALVVIGGPHVSARKEEALKECGADIAVAGEGEVAFEQVVQTFLDNRDYGKIPGLAWRDSEGLVHANPGNLPLIQELDSLPMPAYDLIDLAPYWKTYSVVLIPKRRYSSLMSSRGCPFQCNYCHNIFGKRFRPHSVERVVDEVEYHVRRFGVNDIEFLDDVFNFDHERAMEVCEAIARKDLPVKFAFPNGLRTDSLSEELIQAMVDAGTYFASFALESGSPRIQKNMGKNLNIPAFVENVDVAVRRGIFANGFSMLGFPTETEEEMKQTVEVMCNSRLHTGHFLTVVPFPGTPLYREVERTAPEKLERICYDDQTVQSIYVNLSAVADHVLFAIQRKAMRKFYLNPARMLRNLRDYPAPHRLPLFVPMFLERATKGLWRG